MYDKGDKVMTPGGRGTVVYRTMKGPTYVEVHTYSVALDHKVAASDKPPFPSYSGSLFMAHDVTCAEV